MFRNLIPSGIGVAAVAVALLGFAIPANAADDAVPKKSADETSATEKPCECHRNSEADNASEDCPCQRQQSGDEAESNEGPPFDRQAGRGRRGGGPGAGHGRGGHGRNDPRFAEDHEVFFYLLDHRDAIQRKVTEIDGGVETITESKDPAVADKIREHVHAMYDRIEEKRPIHQRDPLFRALFSHSDQLEMKVEDTENGIRVRETSKDPHVAAMIQAHAKVVSLFVKNGRAELHKNHSVPEAKP